MLIPHILRVAKTTIITVAAVTVLGVAFIVAQAFGPVVLERLNRKGVATCQNKIP